MCFLFLLEQIFRHPAINHHGDDPDPDPGRDAAEDEYGKIDEHAGVRDQESCDEELPKVVRDSACHGYANHGEFSGLFQRCHEEETDDSSCKGVEHGEEPGEQKAAEGDSEHVDGKGVSGIKLIESDDDHQIGEPQLDARDSDRKGNQDFHVGEDQRQSREHSAGGEPPGT